MKRRMKKPKGPKKISYELIPREWATDAERVIRQPMYRLLDELVATYHDELREARIALAWALSWKPDADGRVTIGKCKKASELDRELSPYDFVILISKPFWTDLHVSREQQRALLDHELCHATIAYDETGEPKVDERGRLVYRIRRHDLEEFSCVVERHGCYKHDIEQFADALGRARSKARGWIGFTDLHDTLKDVGVTIAFDRVRAWNERERREVMTWALVRQEARTKTNVRAGAAPACLVEALTAEGTAGQLQLGLSATTQRVREDLVEKVAAAGGHGTGTAGDPFVLPSAEGSELKAGRDKEIPMTRRQSAAAAAKEPPADEMMNTFVSESRMETPAAAAPIQVSEEFRTIPLSRLVPSRTNPRKHFDETRIADLARSLAEKGCIEPIVVRRLLEDLEHNEHFEIVAGECRYRAAKLALLSGLPAVIRPYTDEQVLEIQLLENISRSDLTPLEQARGFRALIDADPDKHNIHTIASRVGMSPAWVWDRVNLLNLLPALQQLLEQERISVGHAIVLARLKPEDQDRVADPRNGGLWRHAAHLEFDDVPFDESTDDLRDLAPRTIRELEAHIARHVRFDVEHAAQAQPLQFDELATRVEAKEAEPGRGKKVIPITYGYQLPPDARSDERTFTRRAWKRADGQDDHDERGRAVPGATCEHAVLGLVVAGEHYGDAFEVCIARDHCEVHWKKEIAEKRKNQKLRESGQGQKADRRESDGEAKRQREQQEYERREKRWNALYPKLRKAAHAAAAKAPSKLPKALFAQVLAYFNLPKATTEAGLPKALLTAAMNREFDPYSYQGDEPRLRKWADALGIDWKACEPVEPASAPAKKTTKAKEGGKR